MKQQKEKGEGKMEGERKERTRTKCKWWKIQNNSEIKGDRNRGRQKWKERKLNNLNSIGNFNWIAGHGWSVTTQKPLWPLHYLFPSTTSMRSSAVTSLLSVISALWILYSAKMLFTVSASSSLWAHCETRGHSMRKQTRDCSKNVTQTPLTLGSYFALFCKYYVNLHILRTTQDTKFTQTPNSQT